MVIKGHLSVSIFLRVSWVQKRKCLHVVSYFLNHLRFRLVKHFKMNIWTSILWQIIIIVGQKWQEMVVKWPFILSDSFPIRVYVCNTCFELLKELLYSGGILEFVLLKLFNLYLGSDFWLLITKISLVIIFFCNKTQLSAITRVLLE